MVNDHTITAQSPTYGFLLGAYHVGVFNAYGANVLGPSDVFLFTPPPPPPTLTSVSPTSGPVTGGTTITNSRDRLLSGNFGLPWWKSCYKLHDCERHDNYRCDELERGSWTRNLRCEGIKRERNKCDYNK